MPAESDASGQPHRLDAVLFDRLTALLDSRELWDTVAGDPDVSCRWREKYLHITYRQGQCRPYDYLVAEAGAYKPQREPYALALMRLGIPSTRVLFVAGSHYDIPGVGNVGMPV